MDTSIIKLRSEYATIERFMQMGKKGNDNYDSTQQPFCLTQVDKTTKNVSKNHLKYINNVCQKWNMPSKLHKLYQLINSPQSEYIFPSSKIECQNWVLLSLLSVEKKHKIFIDNNQKRVIDFSYIYMGMGYVMVCSFDPETQQIFYRYDGGPNGYEAEDNWNKIIKYIPNKKNLFDISHWFKVVEEGNDVMGLNFSIL